MCAPSSHLAVDVSAEHASLWRRIDRVVWDTMVCIRPHLLNSYHGRMYANPAAKDSNPTPGLNFNLDKCEYDAEISTSTHTPTLHFCP